MGRMDDYVEVVDRIRSFYEKHPEGSLRCKEWKLVAVGDQWFFVYVAQAFRTPGDDAPAEGIAWEPIPGKTNFTRDSEAMNCETSAWGRAIAALGFDVKKGIASANEVRSRPKPKRPIPAPVKKAPVAKVDVPADMSPATDELKATKRQREQLVGLMTKAFGGDSDAIKEWLKAEGKVDKTADLTGAEAKRLIAELKA